MSRSALILLLGVAPARTLLLSCTRCALRALSRARGVPYVPCRVHEVCPTCPGMCCMCPAYSECLALGLHPQCAAHVQCFLCPIPRHSWMVHSLVHPCDSPEVVACCIESCMQAVLMQVVVCCMQTSSPSCVVYFPWTGPLLSSFPISTLSPSLFIPHLDPVPFSVSPAWPCFQEPLPPAGPRSPSCS